MHPFRRLCRPASTLCYFPYINRIVCVSRPRNAQPKIGHPIQSHRTETKNGLGHRLGGDENLFPPGMTQNRGYQQQSMATLPERPRRDNCVRQRLGRSESAARCIIPIIFSDCRMQSKCKGIRFMAQNSLSAHRSPSRLRLGFPCFLFIEVIRVAGTALLYIPGPAGPSRKNPQQHKELRIRLIDPSSWTPIN